MDLPGFRELYWLWIVIGMVLSSLVTAVVFLLIKKCFWKAEKYETNSRSEANNFYADSRPYHTKDIEDDVPPLPPRDMFDSTESVNQYEQVDSLPDYLKVEDEKPAVMHQVAVTEKAKEAYNIDQDASSEAYDDVVAPPGYDSEDYDDVG